MEATCPRGKDRDPSVNGNRGDSVHFAGGPCASHLFLALISEVWLIPLLEASLAPVIAKVPRNFMLEP